MEGEEERLGGRVRGRKQQTKAKIYNSVQL